MLVVTVRSGLVESRHPCAVVVAGADGEPVATWGPVAEVYFMRSAAKPFQAHVSRTEGGPLAVEHLAVTCASHHGEPVHVAVVDRILDDAGLDRSALRCPAALPKNGRERARLAARGLTRPDPVFHNCSGKHAAILRAAAARGWPVESYLETDHPLQRLTTAVVADATGEDPGPVGIDGCGVPCFRVSTVGLARAFARLATDPGFAPELDAMHRFPALTSGSDSPEVRIARTVGGAVKGGAEGCIGVAVPGQVAVAAKAMDGSFPAAAVAAVAALRHAGFIPDTAAPGVAGVDRVEVTGGGRVVGYLEPSGS